MITFCVKSHSSDAGEDAHADRVRRMFTKRDRGRRSQGCSAGNR